MSETYHVEFAESEPIWQHPPLSPGPGGPPFIELDKFDKVLVVSGGEVAEMSQADEGKGSPFIELEQRLCLLSAAVAMSDAQRIETAILTDSMLFQPDGNVAEPLTEKDVIAFRNCWADREGKHDMVYLPPVGRGAALTLHHRSFAGRLIRFPALVRHHYRLLRKGAGRLDSFTAAWNLAKGILR